jgi:hypothetical protein
MQEHMHVLHFPENSPRNIRAGGRGKMMLGLQVFIVGQHAGPDLLMDTSLLFGQCSIFIFT